jgi:hypothetical protein
MKRIRARHTFLALATLLVLPLSAWAQAVDVDATTPEPSEKPYAVFSGYDHRYRSNISRNGSFSMESFRVGIGGRIAMGERFGFSPRFTYELNAYDFTDAAFPLQWDNVNQYTLLGLFDWKLGEHWRLLGGPLLRAAGEGSASFQNGTSVGGLLGFGWQPSQDLSLGLMLGALSQLEDDPAIVPIPTVRWKFADAWMFRFGIQDLGGRNGLGPELTWSINEVVDLGIGAQYQRRRFRLDDHGFNKKGVGQETSTPLYVKLGFHPMPAASIELFAGAAVAGEVRVEDKDGGQSFDRGYDTQPMVGLRGEYRF